MHTFYAIKFKNLTGKATNFFENELFYTDYLKKIIKHSNLKLMFLYIYVIYNTMYLHKSSKICILTVF